MPPVLLCIAPLAASEIRLLRLAPGAADDDNDDDDDDDPEIACALIYADMGAAAPAHAYEALSYCWGDAADRKDLAIQTALHPGAAVIQGTLPITASLWAALRALRPAVGQPARVLWVDMVCVNQADLDERSRQVARMRDIYRRARRVVVWLGPGTTQTQTAIRTLQTTYGEWLAPAAPADGAARRAGARAMDKALFAGSNSNLPLFHFPWFRRTWVLQEIANATESVVCCGADTADWASLLQLNGLLPRWAPPRAPVSRMPPIYDVLFGAGAAPPGSARSGNGAILDVLVLGLDLDATDPRDKLFAMLQFGRETNDLAALPRSIVPDYRRPVRTTFALFTKWWIARHRSLRILSAIHALDGCTWQATRWLPSPAGMASYPANSPLQLPTWSWGFHGRSR